jgi:hypothetical protein
MCKHDVNYLMGTADGIVCRKCGKVFHSLASLHDDLEADRAAQEGRNMEIKVVPIEKPKTTRTRKKKEDA